MASTQQDRISVPTPVRVFTGPTTTCQLFTSDTDNFVEIFGAGGVANVPITCILPPFGGPYTIVDGAGISATYPITIKNAGGTQVGAIAANGGQASFAWNGTAMVLVSFPPSYIRPGTGAVLFPLVSKAEQTLSVTEFGAVGDGITDDTTAIQNAINAATLAGVRVVFPGAITYLISATLNIGNGSTAAASTHTGVVLVGGTGPSPGVLTAVTPCTTLKWNGGAAPMISVNGPVQGWGVQNLALDGSGVATRGLQVISGSFGDTNNLSVTGCVGASILCDVNRTGVSINSMFNSFRNITLSLPDSGTAQGILLDGDTTQNSSFNDFENLFIALSPTQICSGIYLRGADSNTFKNVLCILLGVGTNTNASAVFFDYTGVSSNFPESNSFYAIDSLGRFGSGILQWGNHGTPGASAKPNYIYGLDQANGASNPQLDNLTPSLPTREFYLQESGLIAAVSNTGLFTPRVSGTFRINYSVIIQQPGSAGTLQIVFGASGAGGLVQTAAGGSLSATAAAGTTSNGCLVVLADSGIQTSWQVNFSSVTGSLIYIVTIAVERLA